MENDYSSLLALFFCLCFLGYMAKCLVEGVSNPEKHRFSDSFDIGYTSSETKTTYRPVNVDVKIKTKKPKPKREPKPKKPALSPEESTLREHCVMALNALGYGKAEAKVKVDEFLKSNSADNVEDFLFSFMSKRQESK